MQTALSIIQLSNATTNFIHDVLGQSAQHSMAGGGRGCLADWPNTVRLPWDESQYSIKTNTALVLQHQGLLG
jgi:hypothetical protein